MFFQKIFKHEIADIQELDKKVLKKILLNFLVVLRVCLMRGEEGECLDVCGPCELSLELYTFLNLQGWAEKYWRGIEVVRITINY